MSRFLAVARHGTAASVKVKRGYMYRGFPYSSPVSGVVWRQAFALPSRTYRSFTSKPPPEAEATWQVALRFTALPSFVFTVIFLYSMKIHEDQVKLKSHSYWVDRGVEVLENAKMPDYDKHTALARDELSSKVKGFLEHHHKAALLVTGRRGSGKTTLLAMALEKQENPKMPPVLSVAVQVGRSLECCLAQKLMAGAPLFVGTVRAALTKFKSKNDGKPVTLVLSVAADCSVERFKALLVECKRLSYEDKLARVIIDMSSSTAALGLTNDIYTVRVEGLRVRDASANFAVRLVVKHLMQKIAFKNEEDATEIAEQMVAAIGGHPLDLVRTILAMRVLQSKEEAVSEIEKMKKYCSFWPKKILQHSSSLLGSMKRWHWYGNYSLPQPLSLRREVVKRNFLLQTRPTTYSG